MECRFLGQDWPFLAFLGAGWPFPPYLPLAAKTGGISDGRDSRRGFYGASAVGLRIPAKCSPVPGPVARASIIRSARQENRLAVKGTITRGFFVETAPKRYRFGTGTPASGWI